MDQFQSAKFLSARRHKIYQAVIGKDIMDLTKDVLEQNIQCAKEFEKSESGYHQEPIERELGWTELQISKMTTKDANAVLSTLGFPLSGTIAEKKRNVALLNQTAHENKRQCIKIVRAYQLFEAVSSSRLQLADQNIWEKCEEQLWAGDIDAPRNRAAHCPCHTDYYLCNMPESKN